ncbi:glycosyltransferase family 39 protein [Iamia majanohamensis]|uniref:Polyprenol-phosphate-mannose--protein mannosyltransferase n=1 Tax=Iamia majanohamensis TaxID=467976 RepID=A0AAE9YBS8_9ACTN|nr:phospholipid carrier-dependent glycosyltransferase [Iamia majanohamensis]WCO68223.1 glycosyltransferase family 39 protein [Iamia majanohamensis]
MGLALLALVLVAAAGLRSVRLDQPDRLTFDERHYVTDAREIRDRGVEVDRPAHPPGGKLAIVASMAIVGDRPLGWRLPALLGGLAAVAATFALARRLALPLWASLLAAGLVAADGVAVTMSRIGMLDGIQAGLVAAGALTSVLDRQSSRRRWRWVTGALLGAAVAVKWSSAPVLVVAVGVALLSDTAGRVGDRRAWTSAVKASVAPLVLVPAAVYLLSYGAWFANVDASETGRERCPGGSCTIVDAASGWAFEQWDMWDLQSRLETSHPGRSRPGAWLTVTHPVLTYASSCPPDARAAACDVPPGRTARTLTIGNPALWWPSLLAGVYLAVKVVVRRDAGSLLILAYGAALIGPWALTANPGFAFYLAPAVPFAALAVASMVGDLSRWRPWVGAPIAVAVGGAAIVCATWLYPLWTGVPLTDSGLDARLWLDGWR